LPKGPERVKWRDSPLRRPLSAHKVRKRSPLGLHNLMDVEADVGLATDGAKPDVKILWLDSRPGTP